MLQNESLQTEPQTEPSVLPGQVRITPEELKRAIAAIDNRRQAEAQRLAGTIPIEEAVSSLHLDATHEEVWAEVQAQRAAVEREAEAERRPQAVPPQSAANQGVLRVGTGGQGRRRPWRLFIAFGVLVSVLWGTGVFPDHGFWSDSSVSVSSHRTPASLSSLAQIPDGQQVYCDTATLVRLSEGKPLPQIRVAQASWENSWTLIKMNGHVYLHAYTLPITSPSSQEGKPIILDNDDNSGTLEGERTAKITLRIDNVPLQVSGDGDDYTEITIPHFQPDQFTTTSGWR